MSNGFYKVSVVFMAPPIPPTSAAPPVLVFQFQPEVQPFILPGQLLGTSANLRYLAPDNNTYNFSPTPALVSAGQRFSLHGTGMSGIAATHLYLLSSDNIETDITSWVQVREASRWELLIPTVNPPAAGVYQLRIGNNILVKVNSNDEVIRSNPTPFNIAALVNPAGGAVVNAAPAVVISLTGQGFVIGKTEIFLGRNKLTAVTGAPAAGQFQVVSANSIQLQIPTALAKNIYQVRVRVNQVESLPAKWLEVP
jgi:hypothetical protein